MNSTGNSTIPQNPLAGAGDAYPDDDPPVEQSTAAKSLGPLELVVLLFSGYVLIALVVQSIFRLDPKVTAFLDRVDFLVCFVFLADFFVRFRQAESKRAFMKWGWIDFVSSIPMLDVFRFGRILRLIRILRILRAFRSAKSLIKFMLRNRKTSSFAGLLAVCFILIVFSSIAMLQFEIGPESNIKTGMDSLWWALTTMTTVGYGDKYPVTTDGKIVALVLMVAGVGLFGSFTGFMASLLVDPESKRAEQDIRLLVTEIRLLRQKVEAMESQIMRTPRPPNGTCGPHGKERR